jgi:hypothetical protein
MIFKLVLAGTLLSSLVAGAQTGDFAERIKIGRELSSKASELVNQKAAIEYALLEVNAKLANLLTVGEVLTKASESTLPKGCKVAYDGKKLQIMNEAGEVGLFEVYGPQAHAEVVGLGDIPFLKTTLNLDLDSYQKRTVFVFFDAAGNVDELYAEKSFSDHGVQMEFQARCWKN